MARKTGTTEYAVLGMLGWGPASGYDLKKRLEGSVAHFWSESYGQIYPILARLASEGLTERRLERQKWTCPGLVDTAVKGLGDTLLGCRPVSAEQARGYQGCC